MIRWARITFWIALVTAFTFAVLPHPPALPGEPSDKVQHIIAFAVLAVLGTIGFKELSITRFVLWLIAFGALIEIIQAIPALNRDSDVIDLFADAAAALVVASATRWLMRRRKT